MAERVSGLNRLGRAQRIVAAARIRQIFAELIRLAASTGLPRDPAQTPLEFAAVLQREWPASGQDLDRITRAYLKIRYGGFPERIEEVRAVEDSWSSVRAAGLERMKRHEQKLKEVGREQKRKERQA
jgi:hypothetical protein